MKRDAYCAQCAKIIKRRATMSPLRQERGHHKSSSSREGPPEVLFIKRGATDRNNASGTFPCAMPCCSLSLCCTRRCHDFDLVDQITIVENRDRHLSDLDLEDHIYSVILILI